MIDLSSSSNEENLIVDTSRGEELTRRLFDDLSRVVIGPPGDDKITILSNSNEEEDEVWEEKTIGTEDATTFATVNPDSTTSIDTDDAPMGVKNDNSDDHTPDQEADGSSGSGDDAGLP
jgi:hypothetical protein